MWRHLLRLCVVFIHISDSIYVINTGWEQYQRPHELDLLSYMLSAQEELDNTTSAATNDDVTKSTTSKPTISTGLKQGADIKDPPYLVSLQLLFNDTWFFVCGGSVISKNKVLTAAHCMLGFSSGILFRVIVGTNSYYEQAHDQIIDVIQAYIHPNFDMRRLTGSHGLYAHDIAVLKLAKNVTLSEKVQPIQLVDRGTSFVGRTCVLTGYSISKQNNSMMSRLQTIRLTVVSRKACQQILNNTNLVHNEVYIRDLHVCAIDQ